MHLYRTSRPWSVALLAGAAAGGAVLATGALSTAFSGAAPTAVARSQDGASSTPTRLASLAGPGAHAVPAPAAAASAAAPPTGAWQIQVGAFRSRSAADAQLRAAEALVPELAGLAEAPQVQGEMTRARFGGIADGAEAHRLCGRIVEAGGACFVVAPGP